MGRRRRRFRLGNRKRLATIWSLMLLLSAVYWLKQKLGATWLSDLEHISEALIPVIIGLIAFGVSLLLISAIRKHRRRASTELSPFGQHPKKFDRKVIVVAGRIERVLGDRFREKLKRRLTDAYRTITNNNDHANRHIHQRFLVSSPHLLPGENVMIHHNVKFGKLPLKRGKWVEVCGEYVHKRAKRRTHFGKLKETRYGLIHHTHEPKGHLRVYPNQSTLAAEMKVRHASSLKAHLG